MPRFTNRNKHLSGSTFALLFVVAATIIAGCSLKKPAQEVPASAVNREPGLTAAGVPKSFFKDENGRPKRFLCAWAAVDEISWLAQATLVHNAPLNEHCNVEFEITKDALIGKLVNPSYPTDSTKWRTILSFNISKHYYYEREKDAQGRETNRMIENDQRSTYDARPYISVDLKSFNIRDTQMAFTPDGAMPSVHAIEDVEWDLKSGFLGFTANYTAKFGWWDNQARMRINFLQFKSNPNFDKTPFNDQNYQYLNVLHFVGRQVNGTQTILSAAHWDLTKTHQISLIGFPKDYEIIAREVIEDWNKSLEKIGAVKPGHKPFVVSTESPTKYAFDLRRISITWINDIKISSHSPLGIAINSADVVTGEMLWGGITLYGGLLENYVRRTMPTSSPVESQRIYNLSKFIKENHKGPDRLNVPEQIAAISQIGGQLGNIYSAAPDAITKARAQVGQKRRADQLQGLTYFLGNISTFVPPPEMVSGFVTKSAEIIKSTSDFSRGTYFADLVLDKLKPFTKEADRANSLAKNGEKSDELATPPYQRLRSQSIQCLDRTFEDIGSGWADGIERHNINYGDAVKSIVTYLISHEYGHFLGLGHQFKENIMPEKGKVPDLVYNQLHEKALKNMTNSTSVMGYPHPEIEVSTPASEIKPGPQDQLGLRYLYNKEFPVFKEGDADFTYVKIPADGVIPPHDPANPTRLTSYYPQCNDWTASLNLDPECNRFDQGYDPETLVKGYYRSIDNSLISNLMAYTDLKNGNSDYVGYNIGVRALTTFGRIRLFYDYMRSEFKDQLDQVKKDEEDLFTFNDLCRSEDPNAISNSNTAVAKILSDNPKLFNLCRANAYSLKKIEQIVSLKASDYTRINMKNSYVPGGMGGGDFERNWGRIDGSWEEAAAYPLKFAALLALNTTRPWMIYSGWWGTGIWNVSRYNNPAHGYHFSSFYPKDFTRTVALGVKNNLFLSKDVGGQNADTAMGDSVFASSYFSFMKLISNDNKKLPDNYRELLRSQSKFDLSLVAIVLEAVKSEKNSRYYKFNGTVYDFASDKTTPTSELYVLPEGEVIARAEKMYIFPIPGHTLRFYSDTGAYVFAYRVTYSVFGKDPLAAFSIKTELQNEADRILKLCFIGETSKENNGLSTFFTENNEKGFDGFEIHSGIATDPDHQKTFLSSIQEGFNKYYALDKYKGKSLYKDMPNPATCSKANNALGLIVSSAALLNGYWIPEGLNYVEN